MGRRSAPARRKAENENVRGGEVVLCSVGTPDVSRTSAKNKLFRVFVNYLSMSYFDNKVTKCNARLVLDTLGFRDALERGFD